MLPTNTTQAEPKKAWLEDKKEQEEYKNRHYAIQEDPKSNESMDEAGAEGGEDEMTEPKADQDMAEQSSEHEDQGQAQSSDQGLKIQRKGSIMSPMKENRGENMDENEASGEKEAQRTQRTRNNSNKFTTPLAKKRS